MKKTAFTCTHCGRLNVPRAQESWKGFAECRHCGSLVDASTTCPGKTAPRQYHESSKEWGLPISTITELQKRGLLPRDLLACTPHHIDVACAIRMAMGTEEILRAALAVLPKDRRPTLLHPVPADGLLKAWQRYVLNRYLEEYSEELKTNPIPPLGKRPGYGCRVTGMAEMIRCLEGKYALPAATTRPWIARLKKVAYNRVRRKTKGGGTGGGKGEDNE